MQKVVILNTLYLLKISIFHIYTNNQTNIWYHHYYEHKSEYWQYKKSI